MNDIKRIIVSENQNFVFCSSMNEATDHIESSDQPLFIAAENYPSASHVVKRKFLECANRKNLRVFIEYPAHVDGIEFGKLKKTEYERTVVSSDFFGDGLSEQTILVQHNCWFHHVDTPIKAHLALARVAGYRHAVFGIPETYYPVLFQHPEYPNIMISSTCFSNFISARFAPKEDWKKVMQAILTWLNNDNKHNCINNRNIKSENHAQNAQKDIQNKNALVNKVECDWEMCVHPAYSRNETLSDDAEHLAFRHNAEWFHQNIFFELSGNIGVFEGFASGIDYAGHQSLRPKTRGDCTGEAVMVTALSWAVNRNPASKEITDQIMNTLFNGLELPDNNPKSQTYGCLKFYENLPVYYGDDNCRAAISCILASELTDNSEYSKNILRCLLSILRTTAPQGFRHGRLDNSSSFCDGKTWKDYHDEDYIEYRPHYQAFMWAAFLQAYVLTGHMEFLDKAKNAIHMTMEVFPNLEWTNGITQEYARLLLPLAFLIQVEDTEEHRIWLKTVADKLLGQMQECGAIRELMGNPDYGKYPAPQSNEQYGSSEASLIQKNGDPASDLVYTVNYAFIGLHEASMATNDPFYIEAENRLADFLCRIQVNSSTHPYLDGCWMRGFDDELWEFFGSSADCGWGVWCVESGWTNTWIAATFGLRQLNRSLLCSNPEHYRELLPEILKEMEIVHEYVITESHAATVAPGAE